jgi:DNA-binding NarL/FixJ family response regulator
MIKNIVHQSYDMLIIDNNKKYIDGLKLILRKEKNINNIYEAKDGKTALEIIRDKKIDIVITDYNIAGMKGTEITKIIKATQPHIKIIVLTINDERSIIMEIIDSEAEGYILKNKESQELFRAIHKIAAGGIYYSQEVNKIIKTDF